MLSNFFFVPVYQNVFSTLLPEVQSFQITLISFTVKWCVTKEATGPFVSEMQFLGVLDNFYDVAHNSVSMDKQDALFAGKINHQKI